MAMKKGGWREMKMGVARRSGMDEGDEGDAYLGATSSQSDAAFVSRLRDVVAAIEERPAASILEERLTTAVEGVESLGVAMCPMVTSDGFSIILAISNQDPAH
ncbi:hypothetical protein MRB53_028066 [Persea americana]|uniref:Uncharacterized protein n=1 Tax=Persea americana TaxID=3435 RepID=A0ACC2KET7_PERAE|nr:hypothetical protein MRB53_028066 [Persea americana]